MKIWSINYELHFGSVKLHKHCLYCNAFSTDINITIIFNWFLLFKLFLLVSNWCTETKARCIFNGFYYCHLQEVQFQISSTFLAFFIWSLNCSSHFLVTFCYSVIVWVESLTLEMFRSLSISLYLRHFSTAIYGKFDFSWLYLFRLFSGL